MTEVYCPTCGHPFKAGRGHPMCEESERRRIELDRDHDYERARGRRFQSLVLKWRGASGISELLRSAGTGEKV